MSDFWSDPLSTSIVHVCEQRRLWRDCEDAQARLSHRWSPEPSLVAYVISTIISWASSFMIFKILYKLLQMKICLYSFRTVKSSLKKLAFHEVVFCTFFHVILSKQKFVAFVEIAVSSGTVMILSFRTDMPGQTVQTQIRLLLEEQSDQGLHCLPFRLQRLDSLLYGKAT